MMPMLAPIFVALSMSSQSDVNEALLKAVSHSDLASAQTALKRGANPNGTSVARVPLIEALKLPPRKGTPIVKLLLDKGADPNRQGSGGVPPLFIASWRNPEAIKILVERGADIDSTSKIDGWTSLHAAMMDRGTLSRQSVFVLLKLGASPNIGSCNGKSALMIAVHALDIKLVHELLRRGADVNLRTSSMNVARWPEGWSPLHFAVTPFEEYTEIVRHHSTPEPKNRVKSSKYILMIEILLRAGADPNLRDAQGFRPENLLIKAKNEGNHVLSSRIKKALDLLQARANSLANTSRNDAATTGSATRR
ncbi:MAG: ankyrin repeat domain-containing protein [Verrucomicrobiaceae bacterium]|nr:MAG: ankyrin repeat domain-containing protein [Verrucomicrobiaceae bacterium]